MNPSGPTPAFTRRSLTFNLVLLVCLIGVFAWLQFLRLQDRRYSQIVSDGATALSKKDIARAHERFDAYVRTRPTDYTAYIEVSADCLALDQPALALEYAQRGLEACKDASNPERAQLYLQLAQALALTEPAHPQTKAIDAARTALKLDPDNFQMKNALGYMLADNDQNLDEAERLLRQALQTLADLGRNESAAAVRSLIEDSYGWLLYKKNDYPGAIAALTEAVHDMAPDTEGYAAKYYYYHLTAAYRKAGRIDDARRMLAIALQYDPAFPEAKAEEALLPPANTPPAQPPVSATPPAPATPLV